MQMKHTLVWSILWFLVQYGLILVPIEGRLLHASRGEEKVGEPPTPCSCDCCGVLRKDDKFQCAPIALLTTADEELHKLASQCPEMCGTAEEGSPLGTGLVDASRYCLATCSSVVDVPDTQCVDSEELKKIKPHKKTNAFLRNTKKKKDAGKMTIEDGLQIAVAKARMEKARSKAIAAGEEAKRSKMGYELVRRSARKAAEDVGLAAINEIKGEARLDARAAKNIRERYVDSAVKNAQKAAVKIAKVYKDSMIKAQNVAHTWGLRSSQYATAASQRKQMSIDLATTAQGYAAVKEYKEAQDYYLQSQQAMQQAKDFVAKAENAHKTAMEVNSSLPWYQYAESASAANALAVNTPIDIPVPQLPPLP